MTAALLVEKTEHILLFPFKIEFLNGEMLHLTSGLFNSVPTLQHQVLQGKKPCKKSVMQYRIF